MQKFKVGDTVYYATYLENKPIKKKCPVCFGNRSVVLVLGNNETVVLLCQYCRSGIANPSGYITEYETECCAKKYIITEIEIKETQSGKTYEYRSNNYILPQDRLFADEESALKFAVKIKDEREAEKISKAEHLKAYQNKSYSWNAGYHLREAKKLKTKIEYHERNAILCKAKAAAKAV